MSSLVASMPRSPLASLTRWVGASLSKSLSRCFGWPALPLPAEPMARQSVRAGIVGPAEQTVGFCNCRAPRLEQWGYTYRNQVAWCDLHLLQNSSDSS
eukprot:4517950-Amphidinium_carterae.1